MITQVLESSAVWGVLLTLAAFGLGVLINKRTGKAIFNPLLLGTAFVIVVLSVLNIPYDTYAASASPISYLLLPATVSLAVPLYEKWDLLCKNLVAIVAGVLAGVMASLFSVLALALLLDLNHEQYITLLPKSVTTAISMDVSRELGGIATLTGAIVILTGIVGDDHCITAKIEGVKAVVDICSSTSAIAGWSAVSLLRNLASPVCFY